MKIVNRLNDYKNKLVTLMDKITIHTNKDSMDKLSTCTFIQFECFIQKINKLYKKQNKCLKKILEALV